MKKLALALTLTLIPTIAQARDEIRIVGSSTVYPFVTVAAEQFGRKTGNATPIVEATGTGGGIKLFCGGVDKNTPDIANASRAIKGSETELCTKNGVTGITEIKIGYDGIVLANLASEQPISITKAQIFLALAKEIPVDGKLAANPYKSWKDIDASLPAEPISVYGPPPTSGTRDAFVELVMEEGCMDLPAFTAAYADKDERKKACHAIREDGVYIEAGENDNLIVQKLTANPKAFGIFGFSFLDMNMDTLRGATIDGSTPTFENIVAGSYPVSRPLFVYVKDEHVPIIKGLSDFLKELTSTAAIGEEGYLIEKGLIPLTAEELAEVQAKAAALK